jgi:hypothetical protein
MDHPHLKKSCLIVINILSITFASKEKPAPQPIWKQPGAESKPVEADSPLRSFTEISEIPAEPNNKTDYPDFFERLTPLPEGSEQLFNQAFKDLGNQLFKPPELAASSQETVLTWKQKRKIKKLLYRELGKNKKHSVKLGAVLFYLDWKSCKNEEKGKGYGFGREDLRELYTLLLPNIKGTPEEVLQTLQDAGLLQLASNNRNQFVQGKLAPTTRQFINRYESFQQLKVISGVVGSLLAIFGSGCSLPEALALFNLAPPLTFPLILLALFYPFGGAGALGSLTYLLHRQKSQLDTLIHQSQE